MQYIKFTLLIFLFSLGILSLGGFLTRNTRLFIDIDKNPEMDVSILWTTESDTIIDTSPNSRNKENEFSASVPAIGLKNVTVGRVENDRSFISKVELPSIMWFIFHRFLSSPVFYSADQNEIFSINSSFDSEQDFNEKDMPLKVINGKENAIEGINFYQVSPSQTDIKMLTYQLVTEKQQPPFNYEGLVDLYAYDSYRLGMNATYLDWCKELLILAALFLIAVGIFKKL